MTKKVAVIILNWNGANLLRNYLRAVINNTMGDIADIIVADNGSKDDSIELLEREFPQVRTLKFEENLGFAEGYNRAIKETMYEYTVLLNSVCTTSLGWVSEMLN